MNINPLVDSEKADWTRFDFWTLPDIMSEALSVPADKESTDLIVLIPLFKTRFPDMPIEEIRRTHARAAMWARSSWMRNSDACQYNVSVKLYIEDVLIDELRPMLEHNFIDCDNDVIVFKQGEHGIPKLETDWFGLSKEMACFFDERLTKYKRIVRANADMWVMSPGSHTKAEIFKPLLKARCAEDTNKIMFSKVMRGTKGFKHDNARVLHREHDAWHSCTGFSKPSYEYFEVLIEELGLADYLDMPASSVVRCCGAIEVYPIRHFHEHHQEALDWFKRVAPLLGSIDTVMRIWVTLYGNPVTAWDDLVEVPQISGNNPSNLYRDLMRFDKERTPYLLHDYRVSKIAKLFQKHLGAT